MKQRRAKKKKRCTLGDLWKCLSTDAGSTLSDLDPSRAITNRMLSELRKAGRNWDALTLYAQKQGWLDRRNHPRPGDSRKYLVQQSGKQFFTRVPVDVLGVIRGQAVLAHFSAQSVVIEKVG